MSLPDIETKYADDYKEIFWNRIVGGIREGFFEVELITETSDFEPMMKKPQFEFQKTVLKRTIHAKALIPIYSFQSMIRFMQDTMLKYEKVFGKIPEPSKELQKKGDTGTGDFIK